MFEIQSYTKDAREVYGESCEFIGCGWNAETCDTHHIDYQEHQALENEMRKALKDEDNTYLASLQAQAFARNYGEFNTKTRQLPKNDSTVNLSILCPNHHRYVHGKDLGMRILDYIPVRK